MEKINLLSKLDLVTELWSPRILGELNGQYVKIAKVKGEFVWHTHDLEDEFFLVLKGELTIGLRDREIRLGPGEFFIVPRGVEHITSAVEETHIVLFEPISTQQTGDQPPRVGSAAD